MPKTTSAQVKHEIVARYRITVGHQTGSAAPVADGCTLEPTGFTSRAVVIGAFGVGVGFPLADPIIGLATTVAIVFVQRDALKEVFRRLMDAVDLAAMDLAGRTATAIPGVRGADEVKMRVDRVHAAR